MREIFHIDTANIMHEVIDGEVVVVNLDNGTYYSLDGVGADLWVQLADGSTLEALVAGVAANYAGERERIAAGIAEFVRRLQEEQLITASPGMDESLRPVTATAAPVRVYSDPVLEKYTDMEQLLLADPIHEVEESGWPNVN